MIASTQHPAAQLVPHPDDTVYALAVTVAQVGPFSTLLLVLADRLAELDDLPRERMARRMAALVAELHSTPYGSWPVLGFGPTMANEAFTRHLTEDEAVLVAWLALWWLNGNCLGYGSGWQLPRCCSLVPLRLHNPKEAWLVLDDLSPRDPGWFWPLPPGGRRNRRVWNSVERIREGCYGFLGRTANRPCWEATKDAVIAHALQLQEPWFSKARQRSWNELGGLIELVTGHSCRRLAWRKRRTE